MIGLLTEGVVSIGWLRVTSSFGKFVLESLPCFLGALSLGGLGL